MRTQHVTHTTKGACPLLTLLYPGQWFGGVSSCAVPGRGSGSVALRPAWLKGQLHLQIGYLIRGLYPRMRRAIETHSKETNSSFRNRSDIKVTLHHPSCKVTRQHVGQSATSLFCLLPLQEAAYCTIADADSRGEKHDLPWEAGRLAGKCHRHGAHSCWGPGGSLSSRWWRSRRHAQVQAWRTGLSVAALPKCRSSLHALYWHRRPVPPGAGVPGT